MITWSTHLIVWERKVKSSININLLCYKTDSDFFLKSYRFLKIDFRGWLNLRVNWNVDVQIFIFTCW